MAIKQDSSPDHKPFDYTMWNVFENKTNATTHPNIGPLKTGIEEEWNKISEDFILKTCTSFQRRVDTIILNKMVAIMNNFSVSCLFSYFVVYFFKLKLILFYNRVIYHYTRIFLILLPHPVSFLIHDLNLIILFEKSWNTQYQRVSRIIYNIQNSHKVDNCCELVWSMSMNGSQAISIAHSNKQDMTQAG